MMGDVDELIDKTAKMGEAIETVHGLLVGLPDFLEALKGYFYKMEADGMHCAMRPGMVVDKIDRQKAKIEDAIQTAWEAAR